MPLWLCIHKKEQLGKVFFVFQPLMDNLDSPTYDIFEKDPFKYLQYEKVRKSLDNVMATHLAWLCTFP